MNRRTFHVGQASIALVKALLCSLSSEKGAAAADSWLRTIRMVREDLEDETRVVPLPTLHQALVAFVALGSRDAIPRAAKHLVASDCLGIWVRVLRGTTEPSEAFSRFDSNDSQYGGTTRWETVDTRPGRWRGRVVIAHDPALEKDGLLSLGRVAGLAAVPSLFGFPTSSARALAAVPSGTATSQEYEVTWSVPDVRIGGVVGAAIGAALGSVPLLAGLVSLDRGAMVAAVATAVGAFAGVARARDRLARAESHAQQTRVHALERSLSLRDARELAPGGQLEGSVAAGQYRIVRRMGAGATGVIYEAVRISDGVPVAIKLLRAAAAHEAVASDRLRREAEALGLSWHPNVVEVIDHGHLPDGTAYLVMELLQGESLATRLRDKGRLQPRELLPIALQTCDALAAVHAAGVVHRDLKPSNVFLAVDRDDPAGTERVKLLDFGIARVEWEETRITNTGGPLGTPGYMSPEQETGNGEIDGRSDVFSLGAMLFECLVGEPPPPRSPSGLVRTENTSSDRADSGTHKASALVPPQWRAIIDKAMAVQPSDRYQDARAFGQALRDLREGIATAGVSS